MTNIPHTRPGTRTGTPTLSQCQVETPMTIVHLVWELLHKRRSYFDSVIDLGAGDGRFSLAGNYGSYLGYEIDAQRLPSGTLGFNAKVIPSCALEARGVFELAIGNPPFIRNQDIEESWRRRANTKIASAFSERLHGLANLYLYFMWISLLHTRPDGMVALIVPFEWTTRPTAFGLRQFLSRQGWSVDVYRLADPGVSFPGVKTTASVTIIDKTAIAPTRRFFQVGTDLQLHERNGPTLSAGAPLEYARHRGLIYATRGFSPGSQAIFTLTEAERRKARIPKRDVRPCVTTLRGLPSTLRRLDARAFQRFFIEAGKKCWLLRTDRRPLSSRVKRWLDRAPHSVKSNSTCSKRRRWFVYRMPASPRVLYASGFRSTRPRMLLNVVAARNVGTVHGVFGPKPFRRLRELLAFLQDVDFSHGLVPFAGGLLKVEVSQMNGLLNTFFGVGGPSAWESP